MSWDLPNPHVIPLTVGESVIDEYDHTNNAEYLRWVQQASWAHSVSLGLDLARYQTLDRAMVVHRHELDYLAAAFLGDRLEMATWIVEVGRLVLTRRFQLRRPADDKTLLRARTRYACIALSSGRARRVPEEYLAAYGSVRVVES